MFHFPWETVHLLRVRWAVQVWGHRTVEGIPGSGGAVQVWGLRTVEGIPKKGRFMNTEVRGKARERARSRKVLSTESECRKCPGGSPNPPHIEASQSTCRSLPPGDNEGAWARNAPRQGEWPARGPSP